MNESAPWLHKPTAQELHEESRFKLIADPTVEDGVRQIGGNLNIGGTALSGEHEEAFRQWVSERQNFEQSPEGLEDFLQ